MLEGEFCEMIFVTLGSQKFQFNRLLKKIDELVEEKIITEPIFAQIGYSDYKPLHYEYKEFLDRDEFSAQMDRAQLVITHGGTGAIIGAVKKEKKVIAVPRLAKYGEHVDDHQRQIVKQFEELNLICPCNDIDQLDISLKTAQYTTYQKYHSNTKRIIENIEKFIEECV